MAMIQLPLVKAGTTLVEALRRVTDHGASAIIVGMDEGHRLIEAPQLLRALRRRSDGLVGESAGEIDQTVDVAKVTEAAGGLAEVTLNGSNVELLRLTTSTILCRCQADPTHVWAAGELAVPGRCNLDGAPVVCR